MIASLSKVTYLEGMAFLGLYIVKPQLRHQGYGKYLWDRVNAYIDSYTCVVLEGVIAQINNYKLSGFELYDMTARYRYHQNSSNAKESFTFTDTTFHDHIDFTELLAYDKSVFSQSRESFLREWLKLPGAKQVFAKNKQGICGYGQIVKAEEGYRISPLFADNPDIALSIIKKLCIFIEDNTPVYLDIPGSNLYTKSLVKALKLTRVFETACMYYHGHPAQTCTDKVFSKTTLEIG